MRACAQGTVSPLPARFFRRALGCDLLKRIEIQIIPFKIVARPLTALNLMPAPASPPCENGARAKKKVGFYLDFLGLPKVSSESLQLGNAQTCGKIRGRAHVPRLFPGRPDLTSVAG
jgi:hypothetical protein